MSSRVWWLISVTPVQVVEAGVPVQGYLMRHDPLDSTMIIEFLLFPVFFNII